MGRARILHLALLGCLLVTACQPRPRPHVERSGWAGRALSCVGSDPGDAVADLRRGEVLRLGTDAASVLAEAGCAPRGTRGHGDPPVLIAGERHLVVGTGVDRDDVGLVDVADGGRTLVVELQVPGPGCNVTDDWKGHLVLLLEGPGDGPAPHVRVDTVDIDC